ncbi:hypothetical protein Adu01nite_24630 [Paractinoplanes durhamensis]|uniref:Transcriptional regulator n=1 Tax=Paractinoplanes durhamensis TaxID=113563 RepID=A0ABQ3YU49_9ACTN|nr:hypothetical protein Adu01nite_24630 [Actinoplanes durhamensis]
MLGVLTDAARPLTPGDVRALLLASIPLSYSTVVTILTRMHGKGLTARYRDGRAFRYSPLTDRASMAARRMGALLNDADDHASVLRRFVDSLNPGDEDLLRRLLKDHPPG